VSVVYGSRVLGKKSIFN